MLCRYMFGLFLDKMCICRWVVLYGCYWQCYIIIHGIELQDKVNKGKRWMPRLSEAMKDVIGCDKFR